MSVELPCRLHSGLCERRHWACGRRRSGGKPPCAAAAKLTAKPIHLLGLKPMPLICEAVALRVLGWRGV